MRKLTLSLIALSALALVGLDAKPTQAAYGFGFHFGGPRVHVDVGRPHGFYRSYRSSYYHDRGHYDYHPGGYVRHYNHYDYVPGHYDYHHTGHHGFHH